MKPFPFFALFLVLIRLSPLCLAQENPDFEFGTITPEALQVSYYPQDSSAKEVILYDKESGTYQDNDGQLWLELTHTRWIQFYGESEFEWAEVEIPYFKKNRSDREFVMNLQAYTFNLVDGQVVKQKLAKADVYDEQVSERFWIKKFVFPNVKSQSIVSYTYTLKSPYIRHFRWVFQHEIPVAWSQFEIDIPPFYQYRMVAQGDQAYAIKAIEEKTERRIWKNYNFLDTRYAWAKSHVPAFKDEPYITTLMDYVSLMRFQLSKLEYKGYTERSYTSTWKQLSREMLMHPLYKTHLGKNTGKDEILPLAMPYTGLRKAAEITRLVSRRIPWNGKYSIYPSGNIKEALDNREGNSTDINMFLYNMLKAAGFDVKMVMLSTRDHGKIHESYPFLADFNTTLVYLESEGLNTLLDATNPFLPFSMIHPNTLNGKGLIIDKKDPEWIDLNVDLGGLTHTFINIRYDEAEETFFAQVKQTYHGFDAWRERDTYIRDRKAYTEKLAEAGYNAILFSNELDTSKPFGITWEAEVPFSQTDENIFIQPIFFNRIIRNPFTSPTRDFPVDFSYPRKQIILVNCNLPKNYQVENLPTSVKKSIDESHVTLQFETKNVFDLSVQMDFQLAINQAQIAPEAYLELKEIYDLMIQKQAEQLVLKKK